VTSPNLTWLFSLEQIGIKLGLDQIRALVAQMGRPDTAYRSLVIAGTNGKGSVTAMLERGLRAAGYRTGRYISPHLVRLEERFAIDGRDVSAADLEDAVTRVREASKALPSPPSFFEATTAMALDIFRKAHVDVAVLEVGLGGRLDATNVVQPVGVAITAIDFDHQQYLGNTIEAIAGEKAGVIKPGIVAVLGRNPPAVRTVVAARSSDVDADLVYAPDKLAADTTMVGGRAHLRLRTEQEDYGEMTLSLRGRHQVDNAVVAVRLLEALQRRGDLKVPAAAIRTALTDVEWPARLELLTWRGGHVLLDGAHNPAGARSLAEFVRDVYGRRLPVVIGVMRDKQIPELLQAIAPVASHFFCTAAASPRAATAEDVAAVARSLAGSPEIETRVCPNPFEALTAAREVGDPVVVAGSLYLAGEIRPLIT
jgi:dihydrofolate synthase / folylpolyglutamate synthase